MIRPPLFAAGLPQGGRLELSARRMDHGGAIKEAHFQLVLYRNGRNLNLRAADQTRNLHRGSCWFGIWH